MGRSLRGANTTCTDHTRTTLSWRPRSGCDLAPLYATPDRGTALGSDPCPWRVFAHRRSRRNRGCDLQLVGVQSRACTPQDRTRDRQPGQGARAGDFRWLYTQTCCRAGRTTSTTAPGQAHAAVLLRQRFDSRRGRSQSMCAESGSSWCAEAPHRCLGRCLPWRHLRGHGRWRTIGLFRALRPSSLRGGSVAHPRGVLGPRIGGCPRRCADISPRCARVAKAARREDCLFDRGTPHPGGFRHADVSAIVAGISRSTVQTGGRSVDC